jgi:hypothetical protein
MLPIYYTHRASPNIIRMIKPTSVRWAEHAARTGKIKMHTKLLSENMKGRDYLEYLVADGRIILKWI